MSVVDVIRKNCSEDPKNLFCFIASELTNGTEAFDLEDACFDACNISTDGISLIEESPNYSLESARLILNGCSPFLLKKNPRGSTANIEIGLSISTEIDGDIQNHTVGFNVISDLNDIVINWNNVEDYIHIDSDEWEVLTQSWDYLSPKNLAYTYEEEIEEEIEAEFQTTTSDAKEFKIDFLNGLMTAVISIEDGNVTLTSIEFNENLKSGNFDITLDNGTYFVTIRELVLYDIMSSVYIDTSENSSTYHIKRFKKDSKVQIMKGEKCQENEEVVCD